MSLMNRIYMKEQCITHEVFEFTIRNYSNRIELEVLDNFIIQDIICCNNFEYVALAYVTPLEGLWLYIISIENKVWGYRLSCIEVKTMENGYYLAYLRVFLKKNLNHVLIDLLSLKFIFWNTDSSGNGALSFSSHWIKWIM